MLLKFTKCYLFNYFIDKIIDSTNFHLQSIYLKGLFKIEHLSVEVGLTKPSFFINVQTDLAYEKKYKLIVCQSIDRLGCFKPLELF